MPTFHWTEKGVRKSAQIATDLLVIGSDAGCGVVLTDPKVSPVHCEIRKGPNGWRVVDLESRDGTSVNGDFVNQRVLAEGDEIQIGEVKCTVTGLAAAPAARPSPPVIVPAPEPQRRSPARGAAPAATRGAASRTAASRTAGRAAAPRDAGGEDDEEQRPQRVRKKDHTTTVLLVVGGLVAFALFVMVIRPNYVATPNQKIAKEMRKLQFEGRYQEMLDLARGADESGGLGLTEVKELVETANTGLRAESRKIETDASLAEWNALQTWFQQTDFKEEAEYRRKIDEYLRRFAGNDGVGPTQARKDRAKRFGSAIPDGFPVNGAEGWKWIAADADALTSSGKYGDALRRLESWWRDNSVAASSVAADYEKKKAEVAGSASKWVDTEIAKARFALDRGERTKARNILRRAAEAIGIPELAARAEAEASKI